MIQKDTDHSSQERTNVMPPNEKVKIFLCVICQRLFEFLGTLSVSKITPY